MNLEQALIKLFAAKGQISKTLPGYAPRESQRVMSAEVLQALTNNKRLLVEAGTGTGKTFAYLVPILLSGKRVIISTATKHLQDQLFHRDIPDIEKAVRSDSHVALLKGRANYLCIQRLKEYHDAGLFHSEKVAAQVQQIYRWSKLTTSGDISEMEEVEEGAPVWQYATSTTDNCLGKKCPLYADCHLMKARKKAMTADVVVVNHHLFFADVAVKDTGFGELLPEFDAVVFDEAHQINDIATQFLGQSLSSRQFRMLATEVLMQQQQLLPDMSDISDLCLLLKENLVQLRSAFGAIERKALWGTIRYKPQLQQAFADITQTLTDLMDELSLAAERDEVFEPYQSRCAQLKLATQALTKEQGDNYVHWYETYKTAFVIHITPLRIRDHMQSLYKEKDRAWIFTSATLTVENNFKYIVEKMALEDAKALQLDSCFDYQKQAVCYLPKGLPLPRSDEYVESVVEAAVPLLKASKGRAFFLFTSYSAMHKAAKLLPDHVDSQLLMQGSLPKHQLLLVFKAHPNAILLGTHSFWEGVDVAGDALSCLIIDKLPFAMPDDPVLKVRTDTLRKEGKDPFYDYQLPEAVTKLQQGVGRLIRTTSDKGVLMIADPRLQTAEYGKVFMQSLPEMRVVYNLPDAVAFYQ